MGAIVIVSWGELTSSKLIAQSYKEAGTRASTTDYEVDSGFGVNGEAGKCAPTTDYRPQKPIAVTPVKRKERDFRHAPSR